jgi:UPF0755 protein
MNNDIVPQRPSSRPPMVVPPRRPQQSTPMSQGANSASLESQDAITPSVVDVQPTPPTVELLQDHTSEIAADGVPQLTSRKYKKWILTGIGIFILACAALIGWYQLSLRPVASDDAARVIVVVKSGSSPSQIGALLEEKKVIRSKVAFEIHTRLNNSRNRLQAGTFNLSPAESTSQIVGHLIAGSTEEFEVTFYPGATLDIKSTATDPTPSHRQVLEKLGFSDEEITEAFNASYVAEYPLLFSDKPASADLEGYIYGETYRVASGSSVKQILMRTFDEFETKIKKEHLVDLYKKQDLTLYEGLTLASIIQREVLSSPTAAPSLDQTQVAQVFYGRLASGMPLGSDVTFIYAAKKLGIEPISTLDSPYNTRIKTGLPPGPISSPSATALLAVATPAAGDFVYFVAGDDGQTYFARTLEEHEANVSKHCTVECNKP